MNILVVANCGIGGTEKAAVIYAVELSKRGYQIIFSGERGPRSKILEEHGVEILPPAANADEMALLFDARKIDLVHQHAPGYKTHNLVYQAINKSTKRPKLIQTNVFGWLSEPRALEMVDFHLFISKASGAQAFRRARITPDESWFQKCTVVMYPMPSDTHHDPAFRKEFRAKLQISESTLLAIRVGQPSKGKWTDWETRAVCAAADAGANVHLLLIQPPENLLPRLQRARTRGLVTVLPATSDFAYLANLYSASDIMIHATSYGESFGYTIAEGMSAGLPVICHSTPWGDSAQVELVQNGHTGWVCGTVTEMSRRIVDLAKNKQLRKKMGDESRSRIRALANLQTEIDILQEVIEHVVSTGELHLVNDRNKDFRFFCSELPNREISFSEPCLPLLERFKWFFYKFYRCGRAYVHMKLYR